MDKNNARFDAIFKAKNCARTRSWDKMMMWLERATKFGKISEMQLYNLKRIVGPWKADELELDRFLESHQYETMENDVQTKLAGQCYRP